MAIGLSKHFWGIEASNWLNAIFSWLSILSAIFVGLIAFWQNERFKEENDISSKKSDERQEDLLRINDRLIKIEENKECAYLAFLQEMVTVSNGEEIELKSNRKKYIAGITDSDKNFKDSTIFCFGVTNQTNVPIRHFELVKLILSYRDYNKDDETLIKSYNNGGFVPSPIIAQGEAVNYILVANNLEDLVCNKPVDCEINIRLTLRVTSIYNRTVEQQFLIRLQKNNTLFHSDKDSKYFWNYCYESDSKII